MLDKYKNTCIIYFCAVLKICYQIIWWREVWNFYSLSFLTQLYKMFSFRSKKIISPFKNLRINFSLLHDRNTNKYLQCLRFSKKKLKERERVEGKTETFKKSCLTIHNKHARRFVAIRCFLVKKGRKENKRGETERCFYLRVFTYFYSSAISRA